MKKILFQSICCCLLAGIVAAEEKLYIGANLVNHKNKVSDSGVYTSTNPSYSQTYYQEETDSYVYPSIHVGLTDDAYRVYLEYDKTYDKTNYLVNMQYKSLNLNIEGLNNIGTRTSLYYGIHLGEGFLSINDLTGSDIQYGIQIGLVHSINSDFNLEVGLKYTKTTVTIAYNNNGYNGVLTADSISALSVGANYLFSLD